MRSLRLEARGTVQGVGFRPWIYRLALQYQLKGFVQNTSQGATIAIEGAEKAVEDFILGLKMPPEHCVISQLVLNDIEPQGFKDFQILSSHDDHKHEALVLPDLGTCAHCLNEVFDPQDRRYLYPFTNCTHCGPRYSILEALPYDRSNTSMRAFTMCPLCQAEYEDPLNHRFHAQPNACPVCGPQVSLWDAQGSTLAVKQDAIERAVDLMVQGHVLAVKGLGGFHLMVDALNLDAVNLLRKRKARPFQPFAVMMATLKMAAQYCQISPLEAKILESAAVPIVLLTKQQEWLKLADAVAPDNPNLGCLLPCMPLQHILMRQLNRPVVATSGNFTEEPICIDNKDALKRLRGIADFFLVHDRPIVRQVDDSIVQLVCDDISILRRSRGYAPLPIRTKEKVQGILAVGAHQKNTVALGVSQGIVLSQHIGDLDNQISIQAFDRTVNSLKSIYDTAIDRVVCDGHPDYASGAYARSLNVELIDVWHHHAHVVSCMAEHDLEGHVLGVCFDGTGYGGDGTIWGGEFLKVDRQKFERLGYLDLFHLPGGEKAVKEPRRSALGLLYGLGQGNFAEFSDLPCVQAFKPKELALIAKMIEGRVNSPMTSSMGRFFDGVSSIIGICHDNTFEAQAAMGLEFMAFESLEVSCYTYGIIQNLHEDTIRVDWRPMVRGIVEDFRQDKPKDYISTRFHRSLADVIVHLARFWNIKQIVLTGGCFQNKFLTQCTVDQLRKAGFIPYWHKQVPANDGGIALGQMTIAARRRVCV